MSYDIVINQKKKEEKKKKENCKTNLMHLYFSIAFNRD